MRGFISLPKLADFDMVASMLVASAFLSGFVYTMFSGGVMTA